MSDFAATPPAWRRPIFWVALALWIPAVTGIGWFQWRAFTRAREQQEERRRAALERMRQRVLDNAPPAQLPLPSPQPGAPPGREGSVRRAARRLVGVGEPQDFARAITELHLDAQLGNSDAMALLADALLTGDPKAQVPPDRVAAQKWLEQAARARNAMVPQIRTRLKALEEAESAVATLDASALAGGLTKPQEKPDEPAVPLNQIRPNYPLPLRYLGITGEVVVDFIVDPQGKPRRITVVRSSHAAFESAATEAVAQWTFRPARRGGQPTSSQLQVPVRFTLDEKPAQK